MANRKKSEQTSIKVRALLFLVVFLLMLAVIFALLNGMGFIGGQKQEKTETSPAVSEELPSPEPTPIPAHTEAPQQTSEPVITPEPSPEESAQPVETPEPTPTPEPTLSPEPEPEPERSGERLGSGTFRSDTETALNLLLDWEVWSLPEGKAEVILTARLESAALQTRAIPVDMSVDDQFDSVDAPAVEYEGNERIVTEMGSKSFIIDLAQGQTRSFPVTAEWQFRGQYSGKTMDSVTCGGTVTVTR